MKPEGLNIEKELKTELEKLKIVCFLRRKQKKKQEDEYTKVIRYTVVKTYNLVNIDSPVKKTDVEGVEPNEKQIFTPAAAKLLKEKENEQFLAEKYRPNTSAKRNIDFVSPAPGFDRETPAPGFDREEVPACASNTSAIVQALPLNTVQCEKE